MSIGQPAGSKKLNNTLKYGLVITIIFIITINKKHKRQRSLTKEPKSKVITRGPWPQRSPEYTALAQKKTVSGNKVRVCYHLCIRHTLGTVFELHQSSETMHRYFYIIKTKGTYRPSYAA